MGKKGDGMKGWKWIKRALGARARWSLERSIAIGSLGGVRWSVAHGAELNDPDAQPPLIQALLKSPNPRWMCSELLRLGADPNRAGQGDGNTPLHLALFCREAHENALVATRELLAAGADPNAMNQLGDTPLTIAARERCWEEWRAGVCEELLQAGADPERPGSRGMGAAELLRKALEERQREQGALASLNSWQQIAMERESAAIARLSAFFEAAELDVVARAPQEEVASTSPEGSDPAKRPRPRL